VNHFGFNDMKICSNCNKRPFAESRLCLSRNASVFVDLDVDAQTLGGRIVAARQSLEGIFDLAVAARRGHAKSPRNCRKRGEEANTLRQRKHQLNFSL